MILEEKRFSADQPTASIVGVVQRTVNAARRADAKVARLRKEQQDKRVKWKQYQAMMKAEYNKEEQRYHRDQERIQTDLATAVEEQSQAHVLITQAATAFAAGSGDMQVDEADGGSAWDELWTTQPPPEPTQLQTLGRELTDFLHGRQRSDVVRTPVRPTATHPRTPGPARTIDVSDGPPLATPTCTGTAVATDAPAAQDPYVAMAATPPTAQADARLLAELQHYLKERTTTPRTRTTRLREGSTPRQPVKRLPQEVAHPKSPGTATLTSKLEAQRSKLLAERATQQAEPPEPGGATTAADTALPAHTSVLVDDDSEFADDSEVNQLE